MSKDFKFSGKPNKFYPNEEIWVKDFKFSGKPNKFYPNEGDMSKGFQILRKAK